MLINWLKFISSLYVVVNWSFNISVSVLYKVNLIKCTNNYIAGLWIELLCTDPASASNMGKWIWVRWVVWKQTAAVTTATTATTKTTTILLPYRRHGHQIQSKLGPLCPIPELKFLPNLSLVSFQGLITSQMYNL